MAHSTPARIALNATLAAVCLFTPGVVLLAQPGGPPQRPAFAQRQAPPRNAPKPQQEHLGQWMDRHRNLSLQQQQSALEREPGFRDLPSQTQQRMREHLGQLNSMPP